MELEPYLAPREFIDSGDSGVQEFAGKVTSAAGDDVSRAVKLCYAVRDGILYDPYYGGEARRYFRASDCLRAKRGFCIPKAALLAAGARCPGIDRKSTRLNSSHGYISYAVFCLKKKTCTTAARKTASCQRRTH